MESNNFKKNRQFFNHKKIEVGVMFGKMKVVLLILTVGLVSVFWLTAATNERAGKVLN